MMFELVKHILIISSNFSIVERRCAELDQLNKQYLPEWFFIIKLYYLFVF